MEILSSQIALFLDNHYLYEDLKKNLAERESLTGLYNRRTFYDKITYRKDKCYAILMLDIDNFKKVNDTYGHLFGDAVLKSVSNVIMKCNKDGIVGRYGGEELIIYLSTDDIELIGHRAETIRQQIESNIIEFDKIRKNVTVSIGVAIHKDNENIQDVIKRADENLYRAKQTGKNKVVV